ncbi:hypothetical protein [Halorussus lipolyticus]|uniref:hypothetical protein n=1 Tax=Halorussus lipolyticus TaxID=3034024 RepID=UPI0023E7B859|nr:hypothetical protein [Halorussus sp. DT80]
MERITERDESPIGYTWGESDDTYFLRNPEGGFRGVSENALKLLEALADGEVVRDDLDGEALALVERLEDKGYLRKDAPVVRIVEPDDIRLWPRFLAFVVLLGIGVFATVREIAVLGRLDELLTPVRLSLFAGLTVVSLIIHEGGHYLASRRFIDPSVDVGTVNGILPVLKTNTDGAWMLPRNRRRWISLAGPFVELVWLVVVLGVELVVGPSLVLDALVVTTVGRVLLSLNPLIHGDGYWLMVDTFGWVNLRTRGIRDLYERRTSAAAGYVVLSYSLPVVVLLASLSSAVARFGPVAAVLPVGLLGFAVVRFRDRLRRLFGTLSSS